jgi:hypothetical protein
MNCSDKDFIVRKDILLGTAESVLKVADEMKPDNAHVGDREVKGVTESDENEHIQCVLERLPSSLTNEQRCQAVELITKYSTVFSKSDFDIGRTTLMRHKIETRNSRPVRQHLRRHPFAHLEFIDEQVDKMLKSNVIEKANSPWSSNITLVIKKDKSLRFCIDFRAVNAITKVDSYPLPRIDSCLYTLEKAKYFSTIDLRSGYWQLEIDPESRDKTAFVTRRGVYRFQTLPYGLCNGTAAFQRLMDCVLSGLTWITCLCYLDDVIVFGSSFENHLERLKEVFERFKDANLKLHPGKCYMFQLEVEFLGFKISEEGIAPQKEKVQAVIEWPRPTNLTQVRGFVALASYYRRLIPAFS